MRQDSLLLLADARVLVDLRNIMDKPEALCSPHTAP